MNRRGRLQVRAVPVPALDECTIHAMWRLYESHYDHVDRATFDDDLAEKALVFLCTDAASAEIVGFSTAKFYHTHYGGRRVGVYFSGDTIVLPRYWGQTALHRRVMTTLLGWKTRHPLTPLYWYLICSGYRTYLTLVRNFPEHWPRHERPTPSWERGLIDALSRTRYGAAWQPETGVIRLGDAQPVLKEHVAPFTPAVLELPEVRFFVRANPGCRRGDELAMIARVDMRAACAMAAKWGRRAVARSSLRRMATPTGVPHSPR